MAAVEKILLQFDADIKDLKSDLDKVKGQLGNVEKETGKVGSKMSNTFKNVGKAIAGAFAIREVVRFGQEAIRLAATLEGVERAFNRIAAPGLLNDLREATRGTVSDLQLMQNAVKASNFKIPLEELGRLFAFAQQRARETGESVDYLVDSIVLGIGRKSPLILDNLGISAVQLREEFKGLGADAVDVGDVAAAVGRIITKEMGDAGETMITTADKMAAMSASFQNFQTEIGEELLPLIDVLLGVLMDVGDAAVFVQDKMFDLFAYLGSQKAKQKLANDAQKEYYDSLVQEGLNVDGLVKKLQELQAARDLILKARKGEGNMLEYENKKASKYYKELGDKLNTNKDQMAAVNTLIAQMTANLSGEGDGGGGGGGGGLNPELEDAVDNFDDLYPPTSKLAEAFMELGKSFAFIKAQTVDGIPGNIDVERTAKAILGTNDHMELLKGTTAEYVDTTNDLADASENSIKYAFLMADALGMLQQGIVDIAGEQSKFTNFLQGLSIAQILFARSVAIAEAVKGASTGLGQPGGLLKFLATTTFIISQITGFIGDSLKTVRSQQIPGYAEGVVDLKGQGTETSDSIVARLSKGESVITAKGTRQDKGLFEAANKLELEKYINSNYILPALKEKQKGESAMFDDYRLYLTMIKGQKQDKELNKQLVKVLGQRVNRHNNWA